MIAEYLGQVVVIDLKSPYVCLGTLVEADDQFLRLSDADLHDLRDSDTTRENYVAASRATGIKRNRKTVVVVRAEMVAISLLKNVVDE